MEREGQKLLHLESLRGIAALLVVFTHFAGSFFPAVTGGGRFPTHSAFDLVIYSTPLSILAGGNFAVCIFFVLSGFVLTRGYFLNGRIQQLQNSALKRYFRLMPAVAISVLLAYLLLRFQLFFNHDAAAITGSMGLDELWSFPANAAEATNQALYQAFITGTTGPRSYNPVLWTMQIEFLGSFLVFGAAALFGQHAKRHWMYLLLLIGTWQTYFLGFTLGLILADATASGRTRQINLWRWPAWSGLIFLGLVLGGYPSSGSTGETLYRAFPDLWASPIGSIAIYHSLGAALIVGSVVGWRGAQRVLHWKPFVILGRQSFALYLTHLIVIASFSSYLFSSLTFSFGYRASFVLTIVPSLLIIFSVSYLYTRWIDQPSIEWSRRLLHRQPIKNKQPTNPEVPITVEPLPTSMP